MDYKVNPDEWINAKVALQPERRRQEGVKYDPDVSKIVGFNVPVNDRRLINLLVSWRRSKNPDTPDNYLKDPRKVKELKERFKKA